MHALLHLTDYSEYLRNLFCKNCSNLYGYYCYVHWSRQNHFSIQNAKTYFWSMVTAAFSKTRTILLNMQKVKQVWQKFALAEQRTPHNFKAKLLQRSAPEVPSNPNYSIILWFVDGTLPSKSLHSHNPCGRPLNQPENINNARNQRPFFY